MMVMNPIHLKKRVLAMICNHRVTTYKTATSATIREAKRRLKGPLLKFLGQISAIKIGRPYER